MPGMRRPVPRRVGAAALALVLVAGCAPTDQVTPTPTVASGPSTAPSDQPSTSTGPVIAESSSTLPDAGSGLLLAEVRFAPLPGDPPFVEILNAGSAAVGVAGLTLEIDGDSLAVRPAEPTVGAGERLLILFDGPKDPEAGVVHAAGVRPGIAAGVVRLIDADRRLLDRVAWGAGQPRAVSMAVGDFAPRTVEPGTTIGRPPGSDRPNQPSAWVPYAPPSASPGAANAVPPVVVLLPMDGAILDGPGATLEWYTVVGATAYRVQIAADDTFAAPLVDSTVIEPQVETGSLATGHYVWHVQAVAADGSASSVSAPIGFEIATGVAQIQLAVARGDSRSDARTAADDAGRQLNVTWLAQRKDTAMLLLERPEERGAHPWDAAHARPSRDDPADQMNCALAMIAMVNHFYGGDLSQDRIGYELLKDRRRGDPEEDLMYGYGIDTDQTDAAFAFALGPGVRSVLSYPTYDAAWADITASIDADRPVAGAGPHHGYVITGYAVRNGHRIITVNDPARGTYQLDLDSAAPAMSRFLSLWLMPPAPTARMQERSVTTDADGDGVVDFDETNRFHTKPNDRDSDADKVPDKQDIVAGVFDAEHGYAAHPEDGGRDWDGDGIATELDPDSDAGGCQDGEEDKDRDGHRNGKETWNFDISDDLCHALGGTISIERTSTLDTGSASPSRQTGLETLKVTVKVAMETDPSDPNALIDAGSTFTVERKVTFERQVGGDCSPEASISKSAGTYRFLDPPVPSPGHTLDELGPDGHSQIWGMVDRERHLMLISMVAWYPETVSATCQLFNILGLPVIIDAWACGDKFLGFPGLGVDATIKDQPTGPYPVTIDCTFEGKVMNWDHQKLVAKGELTFAAAQ